MSAETMARALGGAAKSGKGWWRARCPAHQDGKASLGLHDCEDGGIAWKCEAGCDKRVVGDALKARGLLPERAAEARRRIVATYPYKDAAGELVLEVVRYEPKDFSQRRPDPDKPGDWIWNLDGVAARPLYRLPELLAADPAGFVYLTEGEKDADALRALGLTATTTAQGAQGWAKSDHSPLHGRHVVLLPDNDDPGRAYAAAAGLDLIGKAVPLRMLELPALPDKGDVSDWLASGGTAEALGKLAAAAPLWRRYIPEFDAPEVQARVRAAKRKPAPGSAEHVHRELADPKVEVPRLARLEPLAYDRECEEAAAMLGCRIGTLDKEVKRTRGESSGGRGLSIAAPEPHPDAVDGGPLMEEIVATLRRFLVLPRQADTAMALWVLHSHAFKAASISPRLGITAPEIRCGKTTALEVVGALVPKPLMAANVSPAAVYRVVEMVRPTLLIDEVDTFLAEREELRGVLNSGHRSTGQVIRVEERQGELRPVAFSAWSAVAIAMKGKLPGSLADRAVEIQMQRRTKGETVERWRSDRTDQFHELVRRCARWAQDHHDELGKAEPDVPALVHDRAADNWRPLLSIADAIGGKWPVRAREAALALSDGGSVEGRRELLLADIRQVFADFNNPEWIATKSILEKLVGMEERPWSEASRGGKPINAQAMRSLLEPFKVFSTSNGKARGYKREAFPEAWTRYLPPPPPFDPSIRPEPSSRAGFTTSPIRQSGNGHDGLASGREILQAGRQEMKRRAPLEIDVAREAKEIRRLAPPHRVAMMGPDFVKETARLICLQSTPGGLGFRESMKLLKHLHAAHDAAGASTGLRALALASRS